MKSELSKEKLRLHKQRIAFNMLKLDMEPRKVRKYVDISARQLTKVIKTAKRGKLL